MTDTLIEEAPVPVTRIEVVKTGLDELGALQEIKTVMTKDEGYTLSSLITILGEYNIRANERLQEFLDSDAISYHFTYRNWTVTLVRAEFAWVGVTADE